MSEFLSAEQLEQLIGRAVRDPAFLEALLEQPRETLRYGGFPEDDTIIDAIQAMDQAEIGALTQNPANLVQGAIGAYAC